jgi:hypothetical protein
VNFITTADPYDGETTVTRKIDGVQQEVKSHIAIKRYNRFMQSVDRNDQLRVAFSLATRHAFKKYYIKYFFSLFDICMTNAMVHYFLRNNREKKKRYHKADFFTKVADELCDSKNRDFKGLYGGKGLAGKEKTMDDALASVISAPTKKHADVLASPECDVNCSFRRKNWYEWQHNTQIIGMKKCCQVCLFKTNKRNSLDVVICDTYCVRLFNGKPQLDVRLSGMTQVDGKTLVTNFSWAAPDPDMNCWDKFHQ